MDIITQIKNEMNVFFGFELTTEQVEEFLNEYPEAKHFDTLERETFANYIGKKITGLPFPVNGDSGEYKRKFCTELEKNANSMGYKWNPN